MIITFSSVLGIIQAGLWTKNVVKSLIDKASNFDKATKTLMKSYKKAFHETLGIKMKDLSYWDDETEKLIKGGKADTIIYILTYFENPITFAQNICNIPGLPEEFKGYSKEELTKLYKEIAKVFEEQIPDTNSIAIALKYLIGIDKHLRINKIILKENNEYLLKIIEVLEKSNVSEFNQKLLETINNQISDALQKIKENTEKILKSTTSIEERMKKLEEKIPDNLELLGTTKYFEFGIERIKNRIDSNQLDVALEDLIQIEKDFWDKLTPNLKFKLKSYNAQIHLIKNEKDKGAELLIESYYCDKKAERALFNIAYGYYLKNDFKNASKYNDKILKNYPENADANTIKILLTNLNVSIDDLVKSIPERTHDIPKISFHIAEFARKKKKYEIAFIWFEKSIKKEKEYTYEIKAIYAKSLIEYVLNHEKFFNRIQLPDELVKKLEYAYTLINEACDKITNTELEKIHIDWLSDIALIRHLLNDSDEALKIIDKALKINNDDSLLNRNKAVILYESGIINDSIPYFEKVLNQNPNSDIVFNLALAYSRINQNEKAIEILFRYFKQKIPSHNKIRAERTLFDLYCQTNNIDKAEEILNKYTNLKYKKTDYARIFALQGKTKEALKILNELENDFIEDMDTKDIFELANGYYSIKEYKKASQYYEHVVDLNKYTPMLSRYIESLMKGGKKGEAYKICENIRKSEGFISELFSVETNILDEIGNLDKTIDIYEDALKNNPDDYQLLLNLAIYYMKQGNNEGVKSIIEYAFNFDKLTLDRGFQLAYLFAENERVEDAFELIYELRRKFYHEQKAHLQFAGFFFSYDSLLPKEIGLLDIDKVSANCAVLINENGQNKTYILDNRKDADLISLKEITKKHALYTLLINKRKGDEFEVEESPFSTKIIKILDVVHKYVYAFRETLDNYNDFFPNASGIYKISLSLPENEPAAMENVSPIFKGVDEQKERTDYFENLYKSNPIPISFVSGQSGISIFDNLYGFSSNEDIGIRCCAGDEDERQKAVSLINFDKTLVLDMVSIFTFYHLKLFEIIKSKFKIEITQSTLDTLDDIRKERKLSLGKKVITIGKKEDQYVRTIHSAEQNTKYYNSLCELQKWLQQNCNIKTCEKRFDFDEEMILKLEKTIGKSFIDSILIACDENNLLLSDDLYIRKISEDVFKSNGIWTQVLLMFLYNRNIINESDYHKYVIDLVCMNYRYISIDHNTILTAIKLAKFTIGYPLTKVLSMLGGNSCDLIPSLRVVDNTIYSLYNNIQDRVLSTTLINEVLKYSTEERDAKQYIHSLMTGIAHIYRLHPIYLKFVLGLLKDWLRLNLLT